MPQADMSNDQFCTESQPEPAQHVHVQTGLHCEQKDAGKGGVSTSTATGDSQGSLSSVLDDLMSASAMEPQPFSSPATVSSKEDGQGNSSRVSPAAVEQIPSSTDSDMMPMERNTSVLEAAQEGNQQQQQQQQQQVANIPAKQESTMTMAAMKASHSALSADRPVRVVFSIVRQDAEHAEEKLKVTLHVRPSTS